MRRTTIACALLIAGCGGDAPKSEPAPRPEGRPPAAAPPVARERENGWRVATSGSAPVDVLETPRLALQRDGSGLVFAYGFEPGASGCRALRTNGTFVAPRSRDGGLSPLRRVAGELASDAVPLPGGGAAVLLRERSQCGGPLRLVVVRFGRDGRTSGSQVLASPADGIVHAALAANSEGALAAGFYETRGEDQARVMVTVAKPGGAFVAPRRVEKDEAIQQVGEGVGVTVAPDGTALIAYARNGRMNVTTVRDDGTFGRTRGLGPASADTTVRVAVTAGGRAAVVWRTAEVRESGYDGGPPDPYRVRAATKDAGAGSFVTRVINKGALPGARPNALHLSMARDGRALVAYDQPREDPYPDAGDEELRVLAYLAQAPRTGGFGPAAVASRDGTPTGAALTDSGRAFVALTFEHLGGRLRTRRHGEPVFVTRETVSGADISLGRRDRPVVAWPGGGAGRRVIRVAERP